MITACLCHGSEGAKEILCKNEEPLENTTITKNHSHEQERRNNLLTSVGSACGLIALAVFGIVCYGRFIFRCKQTVYYI